MVGKSSSFNCDIRCCRNGLTRVERDLKIKRDTKWKLQKSKGGCSGIGIQSNRGHTVMVEE
jgi:hypothetical protein